MEEYLNEKEQWERVRAWLREQGPWIVAGVAVAAAVFGGWRYWQTRTEAAQPRGRNPATSR